MRKNKSIFRSRKLRIISLLIGAILTTVGSAIIIPIGLEQRQNEISAMKGEIIPFNMDYSKDFTVLLGNTTLICSSSSLAQGFDPINGQIGFGLVTFPVKITFSDNKLVITTDIKNGDNATIAKIVNNHWTVNLDPFIANDRNYKCLCF